MLKESLSDPTAGATAQAKRWHPEVPQPILDPTDPRYGSVGLMSERDELEEDTRPVTGERRQPPSL
jgi:hypothetical protein